MRSNFQYWLDGMTPLAYSLGDEHLTDKVQYWMDYIMDHQQPVTILYFLMFQDGMFGPKIPNGNLGIGTFPSNDSWPASLVLKAMTQYYEATEDSRWFGFHFSYSSEY